MPLVAKTNEVYATYASLTNDELRGKTQEFKRDKELEKVLLEILPEAFATVKETCRRFKENESITVQLIGGIVLHQGKIAEMQTGEGKTLVATLPAYLNGLAGQGVSVVTVNNYLAKRDSEWMGGIFNFMGLTIDCIDNYRANSEERRQAYLCDITYGTNNEFGFDYLRDNMTRFPSELVQRKHHYAMIDEVDSVLVDDARTPLIIAGPVPKAENHYMAEQQKLMHIVDDELYFVIDEKQNSVQLTDKGINLITGSGDDPEFFIIPDIERIHSVNQLLKAYSLFEKEVDYVVMDGKVKIVDEQTGRIMDGRRYSDGLHQALEAKEEVTVEAATQTFATITLQNFFRMFHKLAGMTGTAETEAGEFWEIYKLDVVAIPTNRPITRDDRDDLIYKTNREKYNAVIDEVEKLRNAGRPILVGTTTVEISELLGRLLKNKQIPHNVLNAKQHQREADIVAEAGTSGQVTIATNMAGRGTDIKLSPEVKAAGGLAIIGTERHDSRRVDRQLRGRAGRQGDVGSSQFYVSLEDKLMRLFGSERIAGVMDKMGHKDGEVIQAGMITKSIERAQKKVEENNFGIRKRLLEYDDIMNNQRTVIYKRRKHALFGERLSVDLFNSYYDLAEEIVDFNHIQQDYNSFTEDVLRYFAIESEISETEFLNSHTQALSDKLYNELETHYNDRLKAIAQGAYPSIKRLYEERGDSVEFVPAPFSDGKKIIQVVVNLKEAYDTEGMALIRALEKNVALSVIDNSWKEHLRAMDDLKTSVQMAVHEQKDPLLVYKFESFELFKNMLAKINRELTQFLFRAQLPMRSASDEEMRRAEQQQRQEMEKARREAQQLQTSGGNDDGGMQQARKNSGQNSQRTAAPSMPVKVGPKVNRNDPCPCGSGKKYKACHGKG
ncbi:UNVERIFIED_CONTAM: hypothetical protein GTU68_044908 [Idotea baltica]|nr:hypothetical protein [Idotea baltica]